MADMVLAPDQGDYGLDWHCGKASDAVIPGRCEASNPESRDSGSGAKAPSRNDGMSTPQPFRLALFGKRLRALDVILRCRHGLYRRILALLGHRLLEGDFHAF